jgi:hypothetical protein
VAQPVRGLKADDGKRLKDLERENATLKRLLADAALCGPGYGRGPRIIRGVGSATPTTTPAARAGT